MKKLNKIFAVLMSVIAVGGFADTAVSAEMYGDIEYSEYNSEVHIYKYIGSETNVDIPDEINGKKVTAINQSAFQECKSLTSVTIPDSVILIDSYAFYDCPNLKTVNIGSGVEEIKSNAFIRCFDLEEINVDENNQNFLSDDGVLFSKNKDILVKCPTAKEGSYIIPDIVVEIAENAFIACNGLTEIKIPKSVTKIGDFAFLSCSGLTSINIPESVEIIYLYFVNDCPNLMEINVDKNNRKYVSLDGVLFDKIKTRIIAYPQGRQ